MLSALGYTAIYINCFVSLAILSVIRPDIEALVDFHWIAPFHILGMSLNVVALVLTVRDLYLRPFPKANSKLTWLLLILYTGGIGWMIYVFRHALKPRSCDAESRPVPPTAGDSVSAGDAIG